MNIIDILTKSSSPQPKYVSKLFLDLILQEEGRKWDLQLQWHAKTDQVCFKILIFDCDWR